MPVEKIEFLKVLPAEARERLVPYARKRVLRRGERLWVKGDATSEFAFVVNGRIKLIKGSESGRETILEAVMPGELVCANAVAAFMPFCCDAASMEDGTEVLSLPRRDVFDALERHAAATSAFLREVTARCMTMCGRVEEVASGRVERRIGMLLLRLADRLHAERRPEGLWVPVRLTRQDLADLCGTTLETAIRVMSRLARDGIVQSDGKGFLIADRAALEDLVRA